MSTRVKQTGPLPAFDTDAPLADHVKQSAWMYLDDMKGNVSEQGMIDALVIQYGITIEKAEQVYNEWKKVTA